MPDKYFVDTNIFLYSILEPKTELEKQKEKIALDFLENQQVELVISTQVINEVANTLFRKTSLDENQIYKIIEQILDLANVIPLTSDVTIMAIAIKGRYGFSFYDSLIVATALIAKCTFLLTEDLQDQQRISFNSETIQVINPLKIT